MNTPTTLHQVIPHSTFVDKVGYIIDILKYLDKQDSQVLKLNPKSIVILNNIAIPTNTTYFSNASYFENIEYERRYTTQSNLQSLALIIIEMYPEIPGEVMREMLTRMLNNNITASECLRMIL